MNSCHFTGRLTRDPELIRTQSDLAITSFSLAVDMGKNKQGEKQTEFIDMKAFGRTAEVIHQWLKKGREMGVSGRFTTDQWEDKDTGQKRRKSYIIVNTFDFIGGGGNSGGGQNYQQKSAAPAQTPAPAGDFVDDDDIPF